MATYLEFKNFVKGKKKGIPSLNYWVNTPALYVVAFREGGPNPRIKIGLSAHLFDRFTNYHYQHPGSFRVLAIARLPKIDIWKGELMLIRLLEILNICDSGCESMRPEIKDWRTVVRSLFMIAKYYGHVKDFFQAEDISRLSLLAKPQLALRARDRQTEIATTSRRDDVERMASNVNKTIIKDVSSGRMPSYVLVHKSEAEDLDHKQEEQGLFSMLQQTPKKTSKDNAVSPIASYEGAGQHISSFAGA
jgi:hypothetical protein